MFSTNSRVLSTKRTDSPMIILVHPTISHISEKIICIYAGKIVILYVESTNLYE